MRLQVEARSREAELLTYLSLLPTDSVVDLGCGTGYFTSLMGIARDVIGIDVDLKALVTAKSFLPFRNFVLASADRLPFRDMSVTKILCTEVLEHVKDDASVVDECYRILQDGGAIVCSSPNANFPFHSRKSSHKKTGPELHVRTGYTDVTMTELLSKSGFSKFEVSYALPMFGTLLVEVLERFYSLIYSPLESQAELGRLERPGIFTVYRLFFPVFLFIVGVRFPKSLGGSIILTRALKPILED